MTYQGGTAFRRALEDRLLAQSHQTEVSLVRLRKLVAFDRFLARLAQALPGAWLLKGGVALQLRLGSHARTTKDIDVLLAIPRAQAQRTLISATQLDLSDWFTFVIHRATTVLPGPGEGGQRFFVTARLDGRTFESFHVDVSSGDPVIEPAENLTAPPLLAFAGIPPVVIPCYPLSQHLAEKVHAYVRPRSSGANTRVKDLVDILLIAEHAAVDEMALRSALLATFAAEGDSDVPQLLPEPPLSWGPTFRRLASEVGLGCTELQEAITAARGFLEPVLSGQAQGSWMPHERTWG